MINNHCFFYKIVGKSSSALEVHVVGKPSMPYDRLTVTNLSKTGCRLNWQPPKDDGGLPIEYIVEKFTAHSDSWGAHVRYSGAHLKAYEYIFLK